MSMRELILHKHYWSIPHGRQADNKIIQICYDCGKERESPINLGLRAPVQQPSRPQSSPGTVEPATQPAPDERHGTHWDLLRGFGKRLYWKKKLVSS
jgi:hypothetical protein